MGIVKKIWIVGTLFGGLLMAGAGVSPQDAQSNLSAWANFIGINNSPELIQSHAADTYVFYFGLMLIVLVTGVFIGARAYQYWQANKYLSLVEASKIAYEINRDNVSAAFAESDFNNFKANPVGWYAHALATNTNDPTSVSLYGYKPALNILDKIPSEEIKSYDLVVTDKDAYLEDGYSKSVKYNRLHIKRSEMKKRIKEIATWG